MAHDVPPAEFQQTGGTAEDTRDTVDVSHILRDVVAEFGIAEERGVFGNIEGFIRGICHLSIPQLFDCGAREWRSGGGCGIIGEA